MPQSINLKYSERRISKRRKNDFFEQVISVYSSLRVEVFERGEEDVSQEHKPDYKSCIFLWQKLDHISDLRKILSQNYIP